MMMMSKRKPVYEQKKLDMTAMLIDFISVTQTWANNAAVADLIRSDRFQPRRGRTRQPSQRLRDNSTMALINSSAKSGNLRRRVVFSPCVWLEIGDFVISIHPLAAQIDFALHSSAYLALACARSTIGFSCFHIKVLSKMRSCSTLNSLSDSVFV